MIENFLFEMPPHILFGKGEREKLFDIVNEHKRILFISGSKWFQSSGLKRDWEKRLSNKQYSFFSTPGCEPDVELVEEACSFIRDFKPDIIVGIGGGSVIDLTKVVKVLADSDQPISDYMEGIGKGLLINKPGIPCVVLPTTAGTGAEATKNAVIKSNQLQVKRSIRSRFMLPEYVIIDPELALTLDPVSTGMTGMDALIQLLESYVSKKSKPIPRALIKQALPVMINALKELAVKPDSIKARTDAAYGALVSGISLANSGLGAIHGFAASIGGLTSMPHGLVCSIFCNPVLLKNKDSIASDLAELFETSPDEAFNELTTTVTRLISLFHLDEEIKKYPMNSAMIHQIIDNASGSSMTGNPKALSRAEMQSIAADVIALYQN